jgi:hypothetical protein
MGVVYSGQVKDGKKAMHGWEWDPKSNSPGSPSELCTQDSSSSSQFSPSSGIVLRVLVPILDLGFSSRGEDQGRPRKVGQNEL